MNFTLLDFIIGVPCLTLILYGLALIVIGCALHWFGPKEIDQ